jgi:hypothetical protein
MAAYNDANFRLRFPEFSNPTTYPQAMLQMYWNLSTDFITDPGSSCGILNTGTNTLQDTTDLMCAHLTSLALQQQASQPPGNEQGGFVTSASIDKISVTKLAPPADNMFTWWLAQTPYGGMLAALLEVLAVGGIGVSGMPERTAFRKVGGVFF